MKLYKEEDDMQWYTEATLDDLKAALAEHGMVAVPVEPTEAIGKWIIRWFNLHPADSTACCRFYKQLLAMIKAAEGREQ